MKRKEQMKRMAAIVLAASMVMTTMGGTFEAEAAEHNVQTTVQTEDQTGTDATALMEDPAGGMFTAPTEIVFGEKTTLSLDDKGKAYYKFTVDGTEAFYTMTCIDPDEKATLRYDVYSDEYCTVKVKGAIVGARDSAKLNLDKLSQGTYYIQVETDSATEAVFTVNKAVDEASEDPAKAKTMSVDKTTNGTMDNLHDIDCWTFKTDNTDSFYTYTFKNTGSETVSVDIYSDVNCNDLIATRSLLAQNETTTLNLAKLNKNTNYYIKVDRDGMNNKCDVISSYSMKVIKTVDDAGETGATAKKLSLGKTFTGYINNQKDMDCLYFTTDGTESFYNITVTNVNADGIYYEVYSDKECTQSVDRKYYIGNSQAEKTSLGKQRAKKTFYVKVFYSKNWEMTKGAYKVKVNKVADDVSDTTPKVINLNETKNYKLEDLTDVDCFKFKTTDYVDYTLYFANLTAKSRVTVNIYKDARRVGTPIFTYNCNKKEKIDAKSAAMRLKGGTTYYIEVKGTATGTYSLGMKVTGPQNNNVSKVNAKKIRIKWKTVAKATGYEIYRREGANGTYKKLKTLTGTSYIDSKSLKIGKTYYYKVRAYKKTTKGTKYSDFSVVKQIKIK